MRATLRNERKSFVLNPSQQAGDILIASYNVHKCVGLDRRFDPGRIIAVINEINPDLIALQEVDQRFGSRAGLIDMEALERRTGLKPIQVVGRRDSHGWHGNIVLARNAIAARPHQIVLPGAEPRGAIAVDIEMPSGSLRIIAAHFGLLRHSRAQQVMAILAVSKPSDNRPVLLMGDLNEWRIGKRSSLTGLEPTFGPLTTDVASFPARFPVWALDRIMAKPHSLLSRLDVHDTPLARVASDHLPIKAMITLVGPNKIPLVA